MTPIYLLPASPQEIPAKLLNSLQTPRRKIQGNRIIDED
jgi:hypothetical protein